MDLIQIPRKITTKLLVMVKSQLNMVKYGLTSQFLRFLIHH